MYVIMRIFKKMHVSIGLSKLYLFQRNPSSKWKHAALFSCKFALVVSMCVCTNYLPKR